MTTVNSNKVDLIKTHLFKDLSVLSTLRSKTRNYLGRYITIEVDGKIDKLRYLDVRPDNQIDAFSCHLRKNPVVVPSDYVRPITIGIDTSYGNQCKIVKGNACYAWGTVLTTMIDGNASQEVVNEVRKLNRYVLMVSDKMFEQKKGKSCIVPHSDLQDNMFNMLKVVSEGTMMSIPLKKVAEVLSSYEYKYEPGDARRTYIMKDGPLLSGFFEPFGNALLTKHFPDRLKDEYNIYKTVAIAGAKGIPVIGITKHAIHSILAQHYGENEVLDYSIVKQISEGEDYFFIGPFERKHKNNPAFRIYIYYLYLESRFSPLRIELLPDLLPPDIDPSSIVEDLVISLASTDEGEISHKGEDYKLPPCIAIADQTSREIVKQKSAELYEAMDEVRKRIPGALLDRRS
jgi:hypothetical protein